MGSITSLVFMAVDREQIVLPVVDWLGSNNKIWNLFEDARDRKSHNILFNLSEKSGRHFYDIVEVRDRCKLKSLDFLDIDLLDDGKGTTLQDIELISAIRSLTIIIDELLDAADELWCMANRQKNKSSKERMKQALKNSEIHYDLDLGNSYDEEGLFIIIKALIMVMTDALVNNKVFVYVQFTV